VVWVRDRSRPIYLVGHLDNRNVSIKNAVLFDDNSVPVNRNDPAHEPGGLNETRRTIHVENPDPTRRRHHCAELVRGYSAVQKICHIGEFKVEAIDNVATEEVNHERGAVPGDDDELSLGPNAGAIVAL
jgi:hypothetical protein